MHWQLAEVAPAAPLIVDALPALLALAGLLVALGLIVVLDQFLRALFSALSAVSSWIPFAGSITTDVIHRAEHAVSHGLGVAISGIETRIGHQFHALARVASHLWHAIESSAELLFALAVLTGAAVEWGALHTFLKPFVSALKAVRPNIHSLQARVGHLEKWVIHHGVRGIVHRLSVVEHAIADTLPREIKTARDLAKEAEDGVARLWKAVRALPTEATIAGLIAAAIAAAGLDALDWLKCSGRNSLLGRKGCGIWNLLEDVLGLIVDALVLVDICALPQWINKFFGPFESALVDLISSAATAVCAKPNPAWTNPNVPGLHLPPASEITQTL